MTLRLATSGEPTRRIALSPFYDREPETEDIKTILAEPRCTLAIVYGPRGVGKSRLFEEAIAAAPTAYYSYTATERVISQQLQDMSAALATLGTPGLLLGALTGFEMLLDTLAAFADQRPDRPLPIVLDEFPYLAQADDALLSGLEKWWKRARTKRKNLKLFLLGSRVSWMEREALSDQAALKSVRTHNLAIDQLTYRHAASFYPQWPAEDKVRAWGVWGGLPVALEEIKPQADLWQNVEDSTLQPRARLFAEPEWMKYTELRSNAIYSSMMRAIAEGARTPSGIAKEVGRASASEVTPYLDKMREARVIERRASLDATGEAERIALYVVRDPFLAYWYRFVDRHRSELQRRMTKQVLRIVQDPETGLDKLVSELAYEDICRSFLFEAAKAGRLPASLQFDRVGSWWTGGRDTASEELDVVAFNGRQLVIAGECKWTNDPVTEGELADLDRIVQQASADLKPSPNLYRLLFARKGFDAGLRKKASDPAQRILLFEPKDLYW